MNEKNLKVLGELNNALSSPETDLAVQEAKILNPSQTVENSLVGFLTSRMEKIEADQEFEEMVKRNIWQRMPEASFDQLIDLLHNVKSDTTSSTESIMKLFRNETSGKTVIDTLRMTDTSSTANKLYQSTEDKSTLQAVAYLSMLMSNLQNSQNNNESDPLRPVN